MDGLRANVGQAVGVPVFAYRLIAPGTIAEKVLELHHSERALADAVIGADAGLVRGLTRQDLEHFLS